ncbi:MAG TPA: efflux RND transporter periplasmic adaptor subunit, partial [Polyangiaceae bacterium]
LNRTRALIKEGVATGAELDSAEASVKGSTAEVSALRGQIARKVVEAPFAGKLGIRSVNVGQYLSPGTSITTLQSEKEEYVDFSVPQQYFDKLRRGLPVTITARETGIDLKGVVAAVDPAVDPATRTVTLRATTSDPDKKLRPGMFVNVSVLLDSQRDVIALPVTSVVYAPYGDSVFVIEDDPKAPGAKIARQQFVKLGETRGDFVEAVKGLKGGETLVSAGAFKLRNGARVSINNKVGLAPKMDPRPANR